MASESMSVLAGASHGRRRLPRAWEKAIARPKSDGRCSWREGWGSSTFFWIILNVAWCFDHDFQAFWSLYIWKEDRAKLTPNLKSPMISILSHLSQPAQLAHLPRTIRLLYGARIEAGETVDSVLFLLRLRRIFAAWNESRAASSSHNFSESKEGKKRLDLFLTGPGVSPSGEISKELTLDDVDVAHSSTSSTRRETEHAQEHNLWLHLHSRRMTEADLLEALGPVQDRNHEDTKETEEEGAADAYVCGPAAMTDQVVALLEAQGGMQGRVFCEKWW